jgi:hypothetical protein
VKLVFRARVVNEVDDPLAHHFFCLSCKKRRVPIPFPRRRVIRFSLGYNRRSSHAPLPLRFVTPPPSLPSAKDAVTLRGVASLPRVILSPTLSFRRRNIRWARTHPSTFLARCSFGKAPPGSRPRSASPRSPPPRKPPAPRVAPTGHNNHARAAPPTVSSLHHPPPPLRKIPTTTTPSTHAVLYFLLL